MIQGWDTVRAAIPMAWRSMIVLGMGLAVTAILVLPPQPPSAEAPSMEPAEGAAATSGRTARQDATYPAIAEHPLFWSTRLPWLPPRAPTPGTSQQTPGPLADYKLVGIVVSDHMRRALVKPAHDGKAILLGEGEQLAGWTLHEIGPEHLRFTAQGSSYDMSFRKPSEVDQ